MVSQGCQGWETTVAGGLGLSLAALPPGLSSLLSLIFLWDSQPVPCPPACLPWGGKSGLCSFLCLIPQGELETATARGDASVTPLAVAAALLLVANPSIPFYFFAAVTESRFPDKPNNPACLESRDYFLKCKRRPFALTLVAMAHLPSLLSPPAPSRSPSRRCRAPEEILLS